MYRLPFLFTFLLVFVSSVVKGQDEQPLKIVYDIKYENTSSYELPEGLPLEQVVYLKTPYSRVEQGSQLGTQVVITNYEKSDVVILVDLMGKKIALTIDQEELDRGSGTIEPTIKRKWFRRKEIAGYKCKLAIVTYPPQSEEDKGETIQVWYTKDIPADLDDKFPGLKGYPMKFMIPAEGFNQVMTAKEAETVPDASADLFSIPDGYEKMTMEEFRQILGG